jgi:hypothetical protein
MSSTVTKLYSKNYRIDFTSRQITFLDTRFYLTESGNYVPSVTTILDCYPKPPSFYDWLKKVGEDADTIRDEAGDRGSTVHKLTELYDEGVEVNLIDEETGRIDYKLIEWAMFERYVEFRRRFPATIIHSELHLLSDKLGFAGTLDRVIELNGRTLIIDIKTSNSLYDHFWLQMAAYKQLLAEVQPGLKIDGYAILWLNAQTRTDGKPGTRQGKGWQMIERKADEAGRDWPLFQATHKLWLAERGDMKPRELSYQLSHKI